MVRSVVLVAGKIDTRRLDESNLGVAYSVNYKGHQLG